MHFNMQLKLLQLTFFLWALAPSLVSALPHAGKELARRCEGGTCSAKPPVISLAGLQHDATLSITAESECGGQVTVQVHIDVDGDDQVDPTAPTVTAQLLDPASTPVFTINPTPTPSSNSDPTPDSSSSSGLALTTSSSSASPTTTLVPARIPTGDPASHDTLVANSSVALFYQQNTTGSSATSYALVTIAQAKYPAIVLEHTSLIASITCSINTVTLTFTNLDALHVAVNDWQQYASNTTDGGFLLITAAPGCLGADGRASSGGRAHLLVNSIAVLEAQLEIIGTFTSVDFTDIVHPEQNITVDIGHGSLGQSGNSSANAGAGSSFSTFNSTSSSSTNGTEDGSGTSGTGTNGTSTGCGADEDFDVCLDDRIGYMGDDLNFNQLLPGVSGDDEEDYEGTDDGTELTRRGLSFEAIKNKFSQTARNAAKGVSKAVTKAVAAAATGAGKAIGSAVLATYKTLNPFESHDIHPFTETVSLGISSNKNVVSTLWGSANQLYTTSSAKGSGSITIYCVECGVSGSLVFDSQLTFSLANGISKGVVSANGKAHVGFALGIIASFEKSWNPAATQLANIPLSPLAIPGIVTFGPQLSLSVGTTLDIEAAGQLLTGVTLDWPTISTTIDLLNSDKSSSTGWTPTVTKHFDASGQVTVNASMYALLAFEIAVDVLQGKFKQSVSLNDKPEVDVSATFSASTSEGITTTGGACKGVEFTVGLQNTVELGVKIGTGNMKTFPLGSPWQGPQFDQCITLPGSSSSTPSPTSASSTPPTARGLDATRRRSVSMDGIATAARHSHRHLEMAKRQGPSITYSRRDNSSSVAPALSPFNSTLPTNNTIPSPDLSNSTLSVSNATIAGNSTVNDSSDQTNYSYISSEDASLSLQWGDNGNIYVVPFDDDTASGDFDASLFFASDDDVVYGDADDRLLHAYVDTLTDLGVSRLRFAKDDKLPSTSVLVSLALVSFGNSPDPDSDSVLMAVTSAGDYYYPIVCVYKDSYSKVFLAADPDNGAATLARADLQATLTGGEVNECGFVSLLNSS